MVVLRSGVASMVRSAYPNKEYRSQSKLAVDSGKAYEFLQFGLPADLHAGATVLTAKLRLQQYGAWSGSRTVSVQRAAARWRVSKLNWNNKPGVIGTATAVTQSGGADMATWEFDVASDVQAWVDGSSANYGWRVSTSDTTLRYFRGLTASYGKPTLEITYSYAPAAPTSLHPSAGAVSVAKPVLRFDAGAIAALQVQVDAAANAVTPEFDSGEFATTVAEYRLADSSYAGLSGGASTQWRARVKDATGAWSPWSQWATFSRVAKAALAITQPGPIVYESTPPINWTMTGMVASQVIIARATDPTRPLYDSGKRAGTDPEHTPDKPTILVDGASYVVTVRGWDAVAREATTGDPIYSEATATTTLNYEATVSGVAYLQAAQHSLAPWVELMWSRSVMPDGWAIIRDGVVVHVEASANDLLAFGSTYAWRDWTAAPNMQHTYRVAPVVNGETSSAGPVTRVSMMTAGVWIGDPETGADVSLLGREEVSAAYGEEADTFVPVGGTSTVSVVSGLRGLEGTASGLVTDALDRVGADDVATLYAFKADPSKVLRMAWGDVNIPVVLRNVQPSPQRAGTSTEGGVTRAVSVDFIQTGELPFEADL